MKLRKTNDPLISIVKILSDGKFHDGTTIGKSIAISRNAVCKAITKIKEYGIAVESLKAKGYRLLEPLILLEKDEIVKGLRDKDIDIMTLVSVSSTNDYLKKFYDSAPDISKAIQEVAKNQKNAVRFCIAEHMTKGRGRLHRNWVAPFGQNIYLSCFYSFTKDISELAGLSLVISLAAVKTIKEHLADEQLFARIGIKWPNDIVYNRSAKLAGTLIDAQAEANGSCSVIIGVGININMLEDKSHDISQDWTSLRKMSGKYFDRNLITASLINNISYYLEKFDRTGLGGFIGEWQSVDVLFNTDIAIKTGDTISNGCAKGINALGSLLLQQEDGMVKAFSSGDTTIIKNGHC